MARKKNKNKNKKKNKNKNNNSSSVTQINKESVLSVNTSEVFENAKFDDNPVSEEYAGDNSTFINHDESIHNLVVTIEESKTEGTEVVNGETYDKHKEEATKDSNGESIEVSNGGSIEECNAESKMELKCVATVQSNEDTYAINGIHLTKDAREEASSKDNEELTNEELLRAEEPSHTESPEEAEGFLAEMNQEAHVVIKESEPAEEPEQSIVALDSSVEKCSDTHEVTEPMTERNEDCDLVSSIDLIYIEEPEKLQDEHRNIFVNEHKEILHNNLESKDHLDKTVFLHSMDNECDRITNLDEKHLSTTKNDIVLIGDDTDNTDDAIDPIVNDHQIITSKTSEINTLLLNDEHIFEEVQLLVSEDTSTVSDASTSVDYTFEQSLPLNDLTNKDDNRKQNSIVTDDSKEIIKTELDDLIESPEMQHERLNTKQESNVLPDLKQRLEKLKSSKQYNTFSSQIHKFANSHMPGSPRIQTSRSKVSKTVTKPLTMIEVKERVKQRYYHLKHTMKIRSQRYKSPTIEITSVQDRTATKTRLTKNFTDESEDILKTRQSATHLLLLETENEIKRKFFNNLDHRRESKIEEIVKHERTRLHHDTLRSSLRSCVADTKASNERRKNAIILLKEFEDLKFAMEQNEKQSTLKKKKLFKNVSSRFLQHFNQNKLEANAQKSLEISSRKNVNAPLQVRKPTDSFIRLTAPSKREAKRETNSKLTVKIHSKETPKAHIENIKKSRLSINSPTKSTGLKRRSEVLPHQVVEDAPSNPINEGAFVCL